MASFIINHPFFFFFFFSSSFFDPLSNFIPLLQNFLSPTSTLVLILFHEKRDETKNELGMKKKEIVEISRKFTTFNFGKLVDAIFFLSTVRLKIVENEWNDAILDCTRTNIEFQSTLIEKKFWILNQFPSIFFFVSLEDVFIYFPFFFYKIVDTFLRSNRRFIHCYPHSPPSLPPNLSESFHVAQGKRRIFTQDR